MTPRGTAPVGGVRRGLAVLCLATFVLGAGASPAPAQAAWTGDLAVGLGKALELGLDGPARGSVGGRLRVLARLSRTAALGAEGGYQRLGRHADSFRCTQPDCSAGVFEDRFTAGVWHVGSVVRLGRPGVVYLAGGVGYYQERDAFEEAGQSPRVLRGIGVHGDVGRALVQVGRAWVGAEAQVHVGLLGAGGNAGVLRMLTLLVTLGAN